MNPSVASLIYACGIAGLFYLDRDKSARTSKALWLPVVYLWIVGSRPVSAWLGVMPAGETEVQLEGSPVDRAVYLALLIAATCVLVYRGRSTTRFLKANWPVLAYFLFGLASVLWSDFPAVSFKRWTKAIGDLAMILIVVSDPQPLAALRRLFSRAGFVLIPLSMLCIKYYPAISSGYDDWTGQRILTGLTLNKNMLGVITFVLLVGATWRVVALLRSDEMPTHRGRHLLAQGVLLMMGVYVLKTADSNTSTLSFVLGAAVLLTTSLRFVRRHAAAVHVLVLALLLTAGTVMLLGGAGGVLHAIGRNTTLTGRTDIWAAIIPLASNPLVGAGFESFWLSPHVHERLVQLFGSLPLNEAHNGYIEVYLELGWIGVGLIGVMLIDGYRRAVKAFRREPTLGCLFIAYILAGMVYSLTEAGFRMTDPIWIFLLLSVIEASGSLAGIINVGASAAAEETAGYYLQSPAAKVSAMRPHQANYSTKNAR